MFTLLAPAAHDATIGTARRAVAKLHTDYDAGRPGILTPEEDAAVAYMNAHQMRCEDRYAQEAR